jgi:hypothetical protein
MLAAQALAYFGPDPVAGAGDSITDEMVHGDHVPLGWAVSDEELPEELLGRGN